MEYKKIILIVVVCIIAFGAIYLYAGNYINSNDTFYDMGTSANKNTDWVCNNISLVQINPNGTLINNTSPEKLAYVAHSTDFWVKTPLCVEFNVSSVTGNPIIHIYDGKNSFYGHLNKSGGCHIKILVNNTISWWIGDIEQTPSNFSMDKSYIRFIVPSNASIEYNDFKIYSI